MAQITAALIKEVRDRTGAGMMKCKKALNESDGTVDGAIEWLRSQGVKDSVKQRSTEEGAIGIYKDGKAVALAELQCETDFAARNENFKELLDKVMAAGLAAGSKSVEEVNGVSLEDSNVEQVVKVAINTIGENLQLKRFGTFVLDGEGDIGTYIHATTGKLGVAVGVNAGKAATAEHEAFQGLLKQLAMHIAGAPIPPLSIDRDGIDGELVSKERQAIKDEMNADPKDSKKPDNIKEKIIDGKMNRFFSERVLPEQKFVMDDKKSIQDVLSETGKEVGDELSIAWFERWELGA